MPVTYISRYRNLPVRKLWHHQVSNAAIMTLKQKLIRNFVLENPVERHLTNQYRNQSFKPKK